MTDWYTASLGDIVQELSVDPQTGLRAEEAAQRLSHYGPNELPRGKKLRWWELGARQFKNPLIVILGIAAFLTLWLHEYLSTTVIALSILVNVCIGFWQEFRSNQIFEKLRALVTVRARTRRGGNLSEHDARELVPGDIILLTAGIKVPADARLIEAHHLEVNETLLTGESLPVKKEVVTLHGAVPLAERRNMVHTGTIIEQGDGTAVVVATGEHTELGEIAKLTTAVTDETTPLQERLARLGKVISYFVVVFALAIVATGLYGGGDFVEMFTLSVAVAVAAVPEGLPAALSVVLAVASQRILTRKGLVKTLIGAETLGSTTVICTDKTGTLTEGIMKMEELLEAKDQKHAIMALALANEAVILENGSVDGEATDRAKLEYFLAHGGALDEVLRLFPRCAMLPFDADEKYIASFHTTKNGVVLFLSGTPEKLIDRSVLTKGEKERLKGIVNSYATRGYRIIGLAERTIRDASTINFDVTARLRDCVDRLSFLGLAALRDPIRPEAKESMEESRRAGIRTIMATGDHRLTAAAIGRELGFSGEASTVIDGPELDAMSDGELAERIRHIEIFSRVSPKHKMRIVSMLRGMHEVVAMTGDGINDAPALKAADVGVALGAGTDITKEAADIVLLDDSFSTITAAIREGRIAFENIRKVVIFVLANSFTEIILILASLILRIPLPITAVQILWANLVEHGLSNFALAFEPGESTIMRRPPMKRVEPIIDRIGYILIFIVGILTDFLLVGMFLWLFYWTDYSLERIQTFMFAALSTDSLIYIFSIKSLRENILHSSIFNNGYLLLAVAGGFLLVGATIYTAPLQQLLSTIPLAPIELGIILASGLARLTFIELAKWFVRKREFMQTPVPNAA